MPDEKTTLTDAEIKEIARDTSDTVAAEFAEELGGDHGPNGPEITPDLLARIFSRSASMAAQEARFRSTPRPTPQAAEPEPEFEVE